jgi:hypothetical protein
VTAITTDVDARFTEAIGESLLAVLGRRWVHHPDEARHVLESLWTQDSVGIGLQQRLRNPGGRRQQQKMSRLQAETSSILLHAAELTRQIIRNELRINRLLPDSDVQP